MRSIAPVLRCDPARLERIRRKERANKEVEMHLSSSSSGPLSVELAEEYSRTSSATHTMARNSTTSEFRANEVQMAKQQINRKDFDKQIQHDIELQASRTAKRRKTSDVEPNHARKNLGSIDRVHQDQCDTECSTAREKADRRAILRLLATEPRKQDHRLSRVPESGKS